MSPRRPGTGVPPKSFSAAGLRRKSYESKSLSRCSTGRSGYSTKRGEFVITNKERNHRSTIYHVEMPYFMRLSCLDFGMHAGYVPNFPASHGCIRLPEDTARKFFSEIPVGTLVTVQ